jgi:hypothetical protein
MRRVLSICMILLVAGLAFTPATATAKPRGKDGNYNVVVGGMFKGSGTANIGGNRLRVAADVTDSDGNKGELNVTVKIEKNHHFSGNGNVNGRQAIFTGRLDTPDDLKERQLRGVRVTCTFKTDEGRYGKIMGWVPNDKRVPVDDNKDKSKGKDGKK